MARDPMIGTQAGLFDAAGLQGLRHAARENSPQALKQAATQFEALFLDMVMKSMREATPAEGLMDGEQGRMMQGMLDQQYSKALASRGIGLADALVRQMTPKGVSAPGEVPAGVDGKPVTTAVDAAVRAVLSPAASEKAAAAPGAASASMASASANAPVSSPADARADKSSAKRSFIDKVLSHAQQVSSATGIPARFMVAQAALESGWGRREIRNADGSGSHNIFGIKAGAHWQGKVTEVTTTEYVDGVARKRIERFRSYGSYAEAFADYAKMLTHSPRYRDVVAAAPLADANSFAEGLQRAGYATDPLYAQKLARVIARV